MHCLNLLYINIVYVSMHYYHLRMVVYNSVWNIVYRDLFLSLANQDFARSIARSNKKSQMKHVVGRSRAGFIVETDSLSVG